MELLNYLANNVPLFCISAVMLFLSFRNIKIRKRESIYFIIFTAVVLFLSVVVELEKYSQRIGNVALGTIFTSIGYISRPILLFVFVLLANMEQKMSKRSYYILGIPLIINTLVYLLPLFICVPGISKLVFYYQANSDGTASFMRGSFLNFTSHIISIFYLLALVYVSTIRFHGKHRRDGLVIVLCVFMITITVVVEMLTNRNDLLNIVCEICAMINYIFIISINTSKDPLTNIYDRRTYYEDISKYKSLVNGIIQMDMNGLKFLNDNYGHDAGDTALSSIASLFEGSINKNNMCAYRLSGDEFLVLMFDGKKSDLEETVKIIQEKIEKSRYSVAIGYIYYDKNADTTYEEAMKKAEELMYIDKDKYYKNSKQERRII